MVVALVVDGLSQRQWPCKQEHVACTGGRDTCGTHACRHSSYTRLFNSVQCPYPHQPRPSIYFGLRLKLTKML